MKFEVVSFDLQGTLSDSAFSDEFWLETLPLLYSKKKGISLEAAKQTLNQKFKDWGKYDYRYYSLKYWLDELDLTIAFADVIKQMKNKPLFFEEMKALLSELYGKTKLIIISSTTREFIDLELGDNKRYFDNVYSSLDDFSIPGKPVNLYKQISLILNVNPSNMIHIGDSKDMDIDNAKDAGFETFFFDKTQPKEKVIEHIKQVLLQ